MLKRRRYEGGFTGPAIDSFPLSDIVILLGAKGLDGGDGYFNRVLLWKCEWTGRVPHRRCDFVMCEERVGKVDDVGFGHLSNDRREEAVCGQRQGHQRTGANIVDCAIRSAHWQGQDHLDKPR